MVSKLNNIQNLDTITLCYLTHNLKINPSQTCIMAASASKRAKEDDRRKKEKVQEEKEAAKRLKKETKKKEKDKIAEMLQNARISSMSFLKGSAPQRKWKSASQIIRQWGKFVRQ